MAGDKEGRRAVTAVTGEDLEMLMTEQQPLLQPWHLFSSCEARGEVKLQLLLVV